MSKEIDKADFECECLRKVSEDLETIWNSLSMDERMGNGGLDRRFTVLRRILKTLDEFYKWQQSKSGEKPLIITIPNS